MFLINFHFKFSGAGSSPLIKKGLFCAFSSEKHIKKIEIIKILDLIEEGNKVITSVFYIIAIYQDFN